MGIGTGIFFIVLVGLGIVSLVLYEISFKASCDPKVSSRSAGCEAQRKTPEFWWSVGIVVLIGVLSVIYRYYITLAYGGLLR